MIISSVILPPPPTITWTVCVKHKQKQKSKRHQKRLQYSRYNAVYYPYNLIPIFHIYLLKSHLSFFCNTLTYPMPNRLQVSVIVPPSRRERSISLASLPKPLPVLLLTLRPSTIGIAAIPSFLRCFLLVHSCSAIEANTSISTLWIISNTHS